MKSFISILLIATLGLLAGCESNGDYYNKLNVSGEHVVARTSAVTQINGQMFGSFFLGCGSIAGKAKSEEVIGFTWSPQPNTLVVTTVSKSKVKICLDSTKSQPTVEFKMNRVWLNTEEGLFNPNPRSHFDRIQNNINELMESEAVDVVIVRLSRDQLKQETCLPQA